MNEDNKGGDPALTVHRAIMLTVRPPQALSEPGKTLSRGQYSVIFFLKVNPCSGEVDWWRHQPLSKQSSINKMSSRGLWSLKLQVRRGFLNLTHLYSCISVEMLEFKSPRSSHLLLFHVPVGSGVGAKCWLQCQSCAVSKIKHRSSLMDGMIKGGKQEKGINRGRRVWLNGGDRVEFIQRPRRVQPAAAFWQRGRFLSVSMATNALLGGSSQKRSVKWHLLLDLFVKHKVSSGVFIYHNNGDLYTAIHSVQGAAASGEVRELCLCNFISLNAYCGPAVWRLTEPIRTQNHNQTRNASFYTTLTNRHLKV